MVTNEILKLNAKNQLGGEIFSGNWAKLAGLYLIATLALGALAFTGIGMFLVYGAFLYAVCRICVNVAKFPNAEINYEDGLCGFKERYVESLLLYLLQSLFIGLWSLLLYVPGIIKSYAYSMSFYIMQDDNTKGWEQCLDESIKMMDGYKWQLFCLDLSFIGWYLLGFITLGIGLFFVVPYHQMARANFYLALKAQNANVIINPVQEDEQTEEKVEEVIIVEED